MSEAAIFVVGIIVFAVTVWGVVMAGGVALSRIEVEQDPDRGQNVDEAELKKRFPYRIKY